MNYTNFDFSEKGIIRRVSLIAFTSVIGEALSYPFDRLKVREIAKKSFSTLSIFKETKVVLADILRAEKNFGLTYGLRSGIDRILAMNLSRFFVFDFLVGRPRMDDSPINLFQLYVSAIAAQSMGFLLAQPSTTLKLKIQCEPLGIDYTKYERYNEKYRNIVKFHKGDSSIMFKNGLLTGLVASNAVVISEIIFFFRVLRFFYEKTQIKSDTLKVCLSALTASTVTTLITHPIEFIYHRQAIEQLKGTPIPSLVAYVKKIAAEEIGISTFYKGVIPALAKNSITVASTFMIWEYYSYHHRHEILYNYHSKIATSQFDSKDNPKNWEMTGGRNSIR